MKPLGIGRNVPIRTNKSIPRLIKNRFNKTFLIVTVEFLEIRARIIMKAADEISPGTEISFASIGVLPKIEIIFLFFDFLFLGWIGQKEVAEPYTYLGIIATVYYFFFFLVLIPIKKWEFPLGAMNLYL